MASKASTKNTSFTVRIHGQEWTVTLTDKDSTQLSNGEDYGNCIYPKYQIYVADNIHDNLFTVTLFHELFHAYMNINGQLTEQSRNEEIYADVIGYMWAEVLPQIAEWPSNVRDRIKFN